MVKISGKLRWVHWPTRFDRNYLQNGVKHHPIIFQLTLLHVLKHLSFSSRLTTVLECIFWRGVLRGSVVRCLTRNPGALDSSRTGSSRVFVGVSLGTTLQSPSLALVKHRKDMNNVSCRRDMTEILLKAA